MSNNSNIYQVNVNNKCKEWQLLASKLSLNLVINYNCLKLFFITYNKIHLVYLLQTNNYLKTFKKININLTFFSSNCRNSFSLFSTSAPSISTVKFASFLFWPLDLNGGKVNNGGVRGVINPFSFSFSYSMFCTIPSICKSFSNTIRYAGVTSSWCATAIVNWSREKTVLLRSLLFSLSRSLLTGNLFMSTWLSDILYRSVGPPVEVILKRDLPGTFPRSFLRLLRHLHLAHDHVVPSSGRPSFVRAGAAVSGGEQAVVGQVHARTVPDTPRRHEPFLQNSHNVLSFRSVHQKKTRLVATRCIRSLMNYLIFRKNFDDMRKKKT